MSCYCFSGDIEVEVVEALVELLTSGHRRHTPPVFVEAQCTGPFIRITGALRVTDITGMFDDGVQGQEQAGQRNNQKEPVDVIKRIRMLASMQLDDFHLVLISVSCLTGLRQRPLYQYPKGQGTASTRKPK